MQEVNGSNVCLPVPARDVLTDILRDGARQLLAKAIELEVSEWLEARPQRDAQGRRQVVRNGYMPQRTIVTGLGEIAVKQPRVRDRRPPDEREPFHSKILPPYLRKTKSIEELIPWLYLKGISTGGFEKPCRPCWDRIVPAYRQRRSRDSRRCGSRSTTNGRSDRSRTRNTSTCGPMASIRRSAWRRIGSAFWC